jgi:hypothetical protein
MLRALRPQGWLLSLGALAVALAACGSTDRPIHTVDGPVDLAALPPAPAPEPAGRRPYLVQVQGRVDEAAEGAIAGTGAVPERYFPDDALLVLATPEEAARARALPSVRAAAPMKAGWRLDPALKALPFERPDEATAVVVELAPAADAAAARGAIAALGGEAIGAPATWMLAARLPARSLEALADRPEVLFVAPAPDFRIDNEEARALLEGEGGAGPTLAGIGLRGQGQLVAYADGGLDVNSCFFPGGKVAGYDALDPDGGDETGHGTHVAGSIAGDRGGDGIADRYDGLAPAAKLFVQDVGSQAGTGLDLIPADLGVLIGPAYDAGARVHSNSWGSKGSTYGPVARSLDAYVAAHPDLLVLVANGNSGPGSGTVGQPATAKDILSVGASGAGATVDAVAPFSSRGPTTDGRIKPTLLAPGQGIMSAAANQECAVIAKSGTSMATPILAGAAAVARQYFVDGYYPTGAARPADGFAPSAALLKATLIAGATPLGDGDPMATGFGRASLVDSFTPGDGRRLWVTDEATGLRLGEEATYDLELREEGPFRIALAWTDVPGASGSTKPLVNDLDLVVEGPDGAFRGNVLSGGHSVVGGEADRRNVEEVVSLPEARPGPYRVRVIADNLPRGRQAFALAAVGAIADEAPAATVTGTDATAGGGDPGRPGGCATAGGATPAAAVGLALGALALRRRARVPALRR